MGNLERNGHAKTWPTRTIRIWKIQLQKSTCKNKILKNAQSKLLEFVHIQKNHGE